MWFERQFDFRIGPHHLRGRVDRVDRLADGRVRADRLQDRRGRRQPSSCATTSSCRCTRWPRARPGSSSPRGRPTTTCSTTSSCPSREASGTARRSRRSCSRWGRGSSRRSSSRRRRGRRARSATTGSSVRRRRRRAGERPAGPPPIPISSPAPAGAGSAGIRVARMSPEGRSSGVVCSSLSAACSSRSTNAWMSGSLRTASPTWRS